MLLLIEGRLMWFILYNILRGVDWNENHYILYVIIQLQEPARPLHNRCGLLCSHGCVQVLAARNCEWSDHSSLKQFFHPASPMGTLETLSWCWDHRYLQTICAPNRMIPNFPQVTEVRDEQERIASLLVAILVVGIGAGSFLSYPIVNCLWYDHRGPTHCWGQSWIL